MAAIFDKLQISNSPKEKLSHQTCDASVADEITYDSITCRNFNNEYLDAVCNLEERIYPHGWSRALIASEFEREISVRRALFGYRSDKIKLSSSEDLIAYSFSYLVEDELHILNLAVSPNLQGRGLGYYLLAEVLNIAAQRNAKTAYLEVRRSNHAAISMYLKAGFRETSYRKNYYSDNQEDAILMEKDISL